MFYTFSHRSKITFFIKYTLDKSAWMSYTHKFIVCANIICKPTNRLATIFCS